MVVGSWPIVNGQWSISQWSMVNKSNALQSMISTMVDGLWTIDY